ncbi:MAG: twin-arginine translocase TatA/TatE family subunit [candidate division Zixibacteria bacterium]|nr:twin-arginine translocase TatA/TatE family subunit [candidate division Zixibacteria bacterium]MDD5425012.1 twin-arginine translocase TatA/TatE family subunit [candidate division Zixibacteria bacterium]
MFGLGPWELLLVFLAILLLFGAKRLPEIAQGMGKGIKEFKRAMKDTTDEIKNTVGTEIDNPAKDKKNDPK